MGNGNNDEVLGFIYYQHRSMIKPRYTKIERYGSRPYYICLQLRANTERDVDKMINLSKELSKFA